MIFEIISGNLPFSQYVTDIDAQFLPHNFWAQILKEAKQLLRLALSYNNLLIFWMVQYLVFTHSTDNQSGS